MAEDFSTLFKGLSLADLRVDSLGNIRITNKDLSRKLAERKGGFDAQALADSLNTGTCNNKGCFAPGFDELVSNPAARR
ncbi:MAG: hypothetical protein QOK17_3020 [Sphingomonadales bacterium]|jgi:hypothetical protein|nr:hypothetical protein [Sphingomonadales bacterium]